MSITTTGFVSSPGYGLSIEIHGGLVEGFSPTELVRLSNDSNDFMAIMDVPRYDQELPGKIGRAMLTDEVTTGQYEAVYDLDNPEAWGRKGIMTQAMHVLLRRLIQEDVSAQEVIFNIDCQNLRSMGLASKLGARLALLVDTNATYTLKMQDYVRSQQPKKVSHV